MLERYVASLVMCTAFVATLPVIAFAQDTQGKIIGTVKDSDGATVAVVEVSLVHPQQAIPRTALTDANGNFVLDNIAPGNYQINIARPGFVRHRSAVQVTAGATRELSILLEVNPLSEEVTVTAEAGQVAAARTIDTQVNIINEKEILERAPEVVAQVVDEEPGVNLQRTSPSLSAVFVRVLTGRNVAVYLDGVRYTTSAQRGGVGTFFSLIDPSSLLAVEILRGPNRPQYCSDTPVSAIALLTRSSIY